MSDLPNKVKGFTLLNAEKVERALYGAPDPTGGTKGGIADKGTGEYDNDALLAEYDRIGGLIKKGNDKVKTGSFYDFKARAPRKEAKVAFIYNVNGQEVEVAAGEELPGIVKASKILQEAGEQDAGGRKKKVGKKKADK